MTKQDFTSIPPWLSNNIGVLFIMTFVSAAGIILDSRHVTAQELSASQGQLLKELKKISEKIDANRKARDIRRIKDFIRSVNSQLQELEVYVAEAPEAPLTKAREQNIARLNNLKQEYQNELTILLSE